MGGVRAVDVLDIERGMFVRSFMNWSNMFTRLMPRTIAGCKLARVMRLLAFRISQRMRLVGLAARRRCQEFLAAPEGHCHQSRHVKSRARCGDRADDPQQPPNRHNC